MIGREHQIAHQHRVDGPQNPEGHVADGDIQHQILYAEIGVLVAKTLHIVHWVFHRIDSCCLSLVRGQSGRVGTFHPA